MNDCFKAALKSLLSFPSKTKTSRINGHLVQCLKRKGIRVRYASATISKKYAISSYNMDFTLNLTADRAVVRESLKGMFQICKALNIC